MAEQTKMQRHTANRPQRQEAEARQMRALIPTVDVYESDDTLLLVADLPGVKPEDLDIQVDNRTLVVEGRRDQGEQSLLYRRQFHLPEHVDEEHITADCHDGVLKLTLPYRGEVKPRRIDVRG